MTTEAGKRLFTRHTDCQGHCEVWADRDAINAIEAEAVAAERARIAEAVEGLREYHQHVAAVIVLNRVVAIIEGEAGT